MTCPAAIPSTNREHTHPAHRSTGLGARHHPNRRDALMPVSPLVPVPPPAPVSAPDERMTLEQCTAAWLHAKAGRSESRKTATAYQETLADFRAILTHSGHDLDSAPHLIAPLAQGWASH